MIPSLSSTLKPKKSPVMKKSSLLESKGCDGLNGGMSLIRGGFRNPSSSSVVSADKYEEAKLSSLGYSGGGWKYFGSSITG